MATAKIGIKFLAIRPIFWETISRNLHRAALAPMPAKISSPGVTSLTAGHATWTGQVSGDSLHLHLRRRTLPPGIFFCLFNETTTSSPSKFMLYSPTLARNSKASEGTLNKRHMPKKQEPVRSQRCGFFRESNNPFDHVPDSQASDNQFIMHMDMRSTSG